MKLYDLELSGNAYKVRLFLSLLGLEYESVSVNVLAGEQKNPEYLKMNPKGQVPVLDDHGQIVYDSHAILIYLAEKHQATDWYPNDPATRAAIQTWLSTSANEIARGPADARLVKLFGMGLDYDRALDVANRILPLVDQHLKGRDWLAAERATIADVAVFGYVALSADAEISLEPYPHIRAWIERVKSLPRFIPMPGIESNKAA